MIFGGSLSAATDKGLPSAWPRSTPLAATSGAKRRRDEKLGVLLHITIISVGVDLSVLDDDGTLKDSLSIGTCSGAGV